MVEVSKHLYAAEQILSLAASLPGRFRQENSTSEELLLLLAFRSFLMIAGEQEIEAANEARAAYRKETDRVAL
jgi:hypothetical protein